MKTRLKSSRDASPLASSADVEQGFNGASVRHYTNGCCTACASVFRGALHQSTEFWNILSSIRFRWVFLHGIPRMECIV